MGGERERDVEYGWFSLTGMTGASAPFSYLVILYCGVIIGELVHKASFSL